MLKQSQVPRQAAPEGNSPRLPLVAGRGRLREQSPLRVGRHARSSLAWRYQVLERGPAVSNAHIDCMLRDSGIMWMRLVHKGWECPGNVVLLRHGRRQDSVSPGQRPPGVLIITPNDLMNVASGNGPLGMESPATNYFKAVPGWEAVGEGGGGSSGAVL